MPRTQKPRRQVVPHDSTLPCALAPELQAEIRANLHSIGEAQEAGALGDGAPTLVLRALVTMGHDVYCYRPIGAEPHEWNVWLGPLNEDTHGAQGRVTCAEWRARYVELLAAMGWREDAEGEAQP